MAVKTLLTFSIIFFANVGKRLATEKEIPQVNHSPSFYLRVDYVDSIYLSPVTSHEIWTFKIIEKACIIASIDILRYSIHFCLALEKIINPACSYLNH